MRSRLPLLVVALLLSSCEPGDTYDRGAMLVSLADVVVLPSYGALATDAAGLASATTTFCEAPDEARLGAVRDAWRAARAAYLRTEAVGVGPVMDERLDGELDFRPVRPSNIDAALDGSDEITDAWFDGQGVAIKGFPAMEYLLYPREGDALDAFLEAGARTRRCELLAAQARAIERAADRLVTAWSPAGDDYRAELTDEGASAYTSRQRMAVNALVNRQVSVLEDLKLNRLGAPLGTMEADPDPGAVETPYTDHSVAGMLATLRGVRAVWTGDREGVTGIGIDDYVASRDAALADRFTVELDATILAFEAITPPLAERIEAGDTAAAMAAHEALRTAERTWGADIAMTLAVTVTFTDNDGD